MAVYVPLMEKTKNTFLLDVENGLKIIFNLCEKFEYELNILSYSFVKSLSRLSRILETPVNFSEIVEILNSFNSFLTFTENDFNNQLKTMINRYHLIKNDYVSNIENNLNLINEGIRQALLLQMQLKIKKQVKIKSSNLLKERIKIFREQLNNLREEVKHIQNSFYNNFKKYRKRNDQIINTLKNEANNFIEKKKKIEKENDEKLKQKFKANASSNNDYYLLINNIESETESLNKLKAKFDKDIQFLNNENNEERKKYIDSFKQIHDKICKNMDEVNFLHKDLDRLRKSNKQKQDETRSFYEFEIQKFREINQKKCLIKNEVQLMIEKVYKENEIEYFKAKEISKQRIEIEKQKEEIEFKNLQKKLNEKHQFFLNEIISMNEKNSIYNKIKLEYETKYNEYLQQLTSPVFSSAIGYEKSKDVESLLEKKDTLINNILNERTHLITKSKSEIVPKRKLIKYQNIDPEFFIKVSNDERDLLKKLWNTQIDSATKIRVKIKDKLNEIRKVRKDLNVTRRIYLTKKLYLIDEMNSFDYSNYTNQLLNDEKIDSKIESLEDKIFIQLVEFETKNNSNNIQIKQLENELNRLNDSFNRVFGKFYKLKKSNYIQNKDQKQKSVQNQKNDILTKNIIRSKSSQSPNLISPVSSKYIKQKKNFSKPS